MKNKTEKRPTRRKRKNRFTPLFLVIWLAMVAITFSVIVGQAGRYNQLREEYEILQEDIAEAEETRYRLELELEFHDRYADVERLARDRLGFVRPNEVVFRNIATD